MFLSIKQIKTCTTYGVQRNMCCLSALGMDRISNWPYTRPGSWDGYQISSQIYGQISGQTGYPADQISGQITNSTNHCIKAVHYYLKKPDIRRWYLADWISSQPDNEFDIRPDTIPSWHIEIPTINNILNKNKLKHLHKTRMHYQV